MVRAGEAGGVLDIVLKRLEEFLESSQQLKSSVINAMIYPMLLISVMSLVIIFMLMFVIPRFSVMFADMGQTLPLPTRILLNVSNGIKDYWWLLIGLMTGVFFGFRAYLKTPAGRYKWDSLKLRLIGIRSIIEKIEVARFCRTLGTLIKSGVPILQAITIVKEIIGNIVISDSLTEIHKRIKEGEGISTPLRRQNIFPPLAIHMIKVGEETGRLEDMLLIVADVYDREVQNALKRFISLLEPLLILLMSVLVGFIVLSIVLAIFSINEMPF